MDKPLFILRFFFDPGSGICLWAGNDLTKNKFGDYPIEPKKLPISHALKEEITKHILWYDKSLNWNSPSLPVWNTKELEAFNASANQLLKKLRRELPNTYQVRDEEINSSTFNNSLQTLITEFLQKNISAPVFSNKFIQLYKQDKEIAEEPYARYFDTVFSACDAYCEDESLRDEHDFDEQQLRNCVKSLCRALAL